MKPCTNVFDVEYPDCGHMIKMCAHTVSLRKKKGCPVCKGEQEPILWCRQCVNTAAWERFANHGFTAPSHLKKKITVLSSTAIEGEVIVPKVSQ